MIQNYKNRLSIQRVKLFPIGCIDLILHVQTGSSANSGLNLQLLHDCSGHYSSLFPFSSLSLPGVGPLVVRPDSGDPPTVVVKVLDVPGEQQEPLTSVELLGLCSSLILQLTCKKGVGMGLCTCMFKFLLYAILA